MPTVHTSAATVATFDDAVATVKRMLHECWLLSRQMPRFAERECLDNEALSETLGAVEELETILQDQAEPALGAVKQAGEGLVSKDDADEVEHQRVETSLLYRHLAAE
jgi:ferritin-like metal-binding protein YciE